MSAARTRNDNAPGQGGEVGNAGNTQQARFSVDSQPAVKARFHIANPREQRLLAALLDRGATSRHDLDGIAGCENTPDLIFRLRNSGFDLPCERRRLVDRDGETVRIGIYSLTEVDRAKARHVLRRAQ